jgi:AcrR family transcriptional regulator
MTSEKTTRTYRMRRRAELQERTRLRITEAAVELHGTLGPARTSVKAVAERAGVERATVYRHFPDERALFNACSSHWRAANPSPDPAGWAAVADPDERLRLGLAELYAYYGETEEMLGNLLRDAETVPIVAELMEGLRARLDAMREALMRGRRERGRARRDVRAALGHALAFATWSSLVRTEQLEDAQAVGLMCELVAAAGAPSRKARRMGAGGFEPPTSRV